MASTAYTSPPEEEEEGVGDHSLTAPFSYSASKIGGNDYILTEILVRTPAKSLIRFKCVSKNWLSLISSSGFSLLHTLRNPNSTGPAGLFLPKASPRKATTDESEFEFVSLNGDGSSKVCHPPFRFLNFVNDRPGITLLQSCNGLLLCSSSRRVVGETDNYYVFNPATKQYRLLSRPKTDLPKSVLGLSLAFDPTKSPHYKVVCVVRTTASSGYHCQIEIYSSETHCWRLSGDPFTAPSDKAVFSSGVYWNSAIHWIRMSGDPLCFDVDHECLGIMPAAPVSGYFVESSGHLYLVQIKRWTTKFRVFEMESDYSKWFVRHEGHLDDIVTAFPEMVNGYLDFRDYAFPEIVRSYLGRCDMNYFVFCMLSLVREENGGLALVLHVPGKVVYYNLKDNTFKELLDLATGETVKKPLLQFGFCDAYPYIETLALV